MTDTHTTVTAGGLRTLLDIAARTSGNDPSLPMLRGVLLHTAPKGDGTGAVLVATSTDRFMLGQIHDDATGSLPHEVFIDLDSVKRAIKLLALADRTASAALSIVDDLVRLDTDGMTITLGTYVPAVGPVAKRVPDFPSFIKLFDASLSTAEQCVALGPGLLVRIAAIGKALGEQVRFQVQGEKRPVMFEVGGYYRGLVMPQRASSDSGTVPLFIPPVEQAAIDKAKHAADQSAAEVKAKRSAAAKKAAATRAANKTVQPARTNRKKAA